MKTFKQYILESNKPGSTRQARLKGSVDPARLFNRLEAIRGKLATGTIGRETAAAKYSAEAQRTKDIKSRIR